MLSNNNGASGAAGDQNDLLFVKEMELKPKNSVPLHPLRLSITILMRSRNQNTTITVRTTEETE